ncbi:oxidoreductase [soil metagenome]
MRLKQILSLLLITSSNFLFSQNLARLADSVESGFRGLTVVSEKVVWMSGRKGLVGNSYNGAKSWSWNRVKGFENSDFRSIYAFDKNNAVIANAGFPATILFTTDAGKKWNTTFTSKDSAMFFDGIDFWDNIHGLIFGDPVNGRMYLTETFDGGKTWKEIPFEDRPQLQNGEAAFAASGTTIRTLPGGHVYIATGGSISRLWHSRDYGHHWEVFTTPILQGKPSQGIFSLAFYDTLHGIIVGGDYLSDTLRKDNCFLTDDGGKTWQAPKTSPHGYRSCVEYSDEWIIATGSSGTDISTDKGETWLMIMEGEGTERIRRKGSNTVRRVPGSMHFMYCGGKDGFRN